MQINKKNLSNQNEPSVIYIYLTIFFPVALQADVHAGLHAPHHVCRGYLRPRDQLRQPGL